MSQQNKALSVTLTIIRVFVGILFIFSGLIKANDPSGLAYKMGEFFEIWAREGYMPSLMNWMNGYSLAFSIAMITFEIIAGVALIIGYRFKLFSYLILLLTIFFTFLTGYANFSGKVKECGCFGDCIKLQANESFMKDLILLALILILVFFRKKITQAFSNSIATAVMIITLVVTLWMQFYVLKHLPFKDCLAYKVGNNLYKEMTPGADFVEAEYKSVLTYKNKKTGELKDFDANNIPWQDTLNWEFADTKNTMVKPAQNEPPIKDFVIGDYDGNDVTKNIVQYPGFVFVVFIKLVDEANTQNIDALRSLVEDCKKAGIPIIAISASNDIETKKFNEQHKLNIDFYTVDGTVAKTAMRTNPGVMLLNAGNVMGKWSYADYPNLAKLQLNVSGAQAPLFAPAVVEPVTTDSVQGN
ncbi:MAG: DoxX family protein [Bacteroidetes bacterium]|nr:DoxX family protein [Bacteroidota bacterium]